MPPVISINLSYTSCFFVVDGLGSAGFFASHVEPFRKPVDAYDSLGAQQVGTGYGKLTHRTATPYRNGIAWLNIAIFRCHVSGGKNVGKKQNLFIRQAFRNLDSADVGEWHPSVFRLTASKAAKHVRVAINSGGGMAE